MNKATNKENQMSYLKTFFAEKNLDPFVVTVETSDGTTHIIESEVVIEAIHGTVGDERKAIENMIRRIDFANGDVNDFLRHLARGLAENAPSW